MVHLHNSRPCSDAENFRIRELFTRKLEYPLFDSHRQSNSSECVRHNQPGVGYILFASPGFNVGKTGEPAIVTDCNDGFPLSHLSYDVFRRSSGYACPSFAGRNKYFFADFICIHSVALISHHYFYGHTNKLTRHNWPFKHYNWIWK